MSDRPGSTSRRLRVVAPIVGIVVFLAVWEAFVQLRDVRKWQHRRRLERDAQLVLPLPNAVLRRALAYALAASDRDDVLNALAELPHSSDDGDESDASILADCWRERTARCALAAIELDERREELDYEYE